MSSDRSNPEYRKPQWLIHALAALGLMAGLSACNGGSSTTLAPPSSTSTPPAVADPWNPPLGDVLEGVTFADGWGELHELPAPVQTQGGWTDSLMAAPSGLKLYYAYSRYDFFDFYISNGAQQTVTGPANGLSGNTFKIFEADLSASGWTAALSSMNSSDPSIVEASPAVNVSGDLMIYTQFNTYTGRASLYYANLSNGTWVPGGILGFNSEACNDDNAKIVGEMTTTVTIYFESNRANDAGTGTSCNTNRNLYYTTYSNGSFTPVKPVPGIAVSGSDDSQPFITADQNTLYWTSVRNGTYGIFTATRQNDGSFGNIHAIATPTLAAPFSGKIALLGEASVVSLSQGKLLYMMCGEAENLHNGQTWHDADFIALKPCVAKLP
ncbi:MAG: hypothetical protein ACRETO_02330 [Gammaproteobacteria bacterium]